MRIDIATGVNIGDTLYNCFLNPMIVVDKTIFRTDIGRIDHIKFTLKDAQNYTHEYDCNDLYLSNLDDESDEEKAWINWAKDNQDFFGLFDHISTIKEIYKIGFANGFEHKRKISFQEMLQK